MLTYEMDQNKKISHTQKRNYTSSCNQITRSRGAGGTAQQLRALAILTEQLPHRQLIALDNLFQGIWLLFFGLLRYQVCTWSILTCTYIHIKIKPNTSLYKKKKIIVETLKSPGLELSPLVFHIHNSNYQIPTVCLFRDKRQPSTAILHGFLKNTAKMNQLRVT